MFDGLVALVCFQQAWSLVLVLRTLKNTRIKFRCFVRHILRSSPAKTVKVEAATPSSVLFAAILLNCDADRFTFWKLFGTGQSERAARSHLARHVNMASKTVSHFFAGKPFRSNVHLPLWC